ncbi:MULTISPECIES: helix-turn-helix domain-containing protein [Streptomyces]|jgi:transcriptional regulator with XRE-family HTH domain|uniref:Transcriptional regulator with XRE-family HTH domain n=1 Tax=Streptomyces nymphaeiformis TaxID=2663842 RepID=A0A7W7TW34_9ACTN|nr:helix-turn-helix transcriptional regulator [Streptomyces nymphaeiformis]MBB4979602.1 transcriptional regulator with XRE-family HTH domain [Streptomyces nymphaeiformis]
MTNTSSSPPPHGPQARFAAELRELRRQNLTKPTLDALGRSMGCARSNVSLILSGRRFPSWEHMCALVEALGGNPADWRDRWLGARREIEEAGRAGDAGPAAPPPLLPPVASVLAGGEALPGIHWYKDNREFYEAAAERVRGAASEIRVTYTRRYPPDQTSTNASREYFRSVLDWAAADSEDVRAVRRIIGVPEREGVPDKDVLAWVRRHHEEAEGILNYEAAVLRWTAAADGLNMALIDDSVAFLAFSGGSRQRLDGFSVEHPRFMGYFAAYFDQLWVALPSLAHYLEELPDGRS